jgi:hypothetical protein
MLAETPCGRSRPECRSPAARTAVLVPLLPLLLYSSPRVLVPRFNRLGRLFLAALLRRARFRSGFRLFRHHLGISGWVLR